MTAELAPAFTSTAVLRARPRTMQDLVEDLGCIPLERIAASPPPGTATEEDQLRVSETTDQLFELVDGVLVEKPMGWYESRLAAVLIYLLERFLEEHDLGIALAPDAFLKLSPGLVRAPDVSFLSWSHFPDRMPPEARVPDLTPDLAVEILSATNTTKEMARKRREYFAGGASLVWEMDPPSRTVKVYTDPDTFTTMAEADTLDGAVVIPGFQLPVREWFQRTRFAHQPKELP